MVLFEGMDNSQTVVGIVATLIVVGAYFGFRNAWRMATGLFASLGELPKLTGELKLFREGQTELTRLQEGHLKVAVESVKQIEKLQKAVSQFTGVVLASSGDPKPPKKDTLEEYDPVEAARAYEIDQYEEKGLSRDEAEIRVSADNAMRQPGL